MRPIPNSIVPLLSILLFAGAAGMVMAIFAYRWQFNGPASADPAVWGQFGDFLGGTLNPVFAYLSFTALVITLALQTRQLSLSVQQLELSKAELEATRLELQRSADAQAATATALTRQAEMGSLSARISAVSVALEALEKELSKYSAVHDPSNTAYAVKRELEEEKSALLSELKAAIVKVRSAA